MTQTNGIAPMVMPTAERLMDGMQALKDAAEAGKWTLIAPDGRVWMNTDVMHIFAVLAQLMQGRELKFGG